MRTRFMEVNKLKPLTVSAPVNSEFGRSSQYNTAAPRFGVRPALTSPPNPRLILHILDAQINGAVSELGDGATSPVKHNSHSYLLCLWLRGRAPVWVVMPAALALVLFVWLLTLHPTDAGRVYAAYGGVYIAVALAWLWLVEGVRVLRLPYMEPLASQVKNKNASNTKLGIRIPIDQAIYPKKLGIRIPECSAMALTIKFGAFPI